MILNEIPKDKFLLIAGPCAIEGEEISIKIAEKLLSITSKLSHHAVLYPLQDLEKQKVIKCSGACKNLRISRDSMEPA